MLRAESPGGKLEDIQGASKKSWFSGKSALANIDADSKKSRSNS